MSLKLPWWSVAAPFAGWLALLAAGSAGWQAGLMAAALIATVLAAVHHAETVAHRVGEPFGTLILAVAVTVIEVGLIVSLMLAATGSAPTLARDTVFAAVMIILNGLLGLCLMAGALRHREQIFNQAGVSAALAALAALTVLPLVLPNYTTSVPGPVYSPGQLAFVAFVSLLLYLTFVLVQTVRHRDYFLPEDPAAAADEDTHAAPPPAATAWAAFALLLVSLGAVILLAKTLSPVFREAVSGAPAPDAIVGVAIAAMVLMPESLAAVRAARADRLQSSLNLALGSALATIGLTIPAVALIALLFDLPLALGLDGKGIALLALTLLVATLSLGTGRTTVLQGAVHLVIFAVFLFVTVVP
jgi:Ca2+:H+ antiporter